MAESQVVELYKLAVEMADRATARRQTANAFFMTLHAVLLPLIGFVGDGSWPSIMVTVTCAGGVVVSLAWLALLQSYRELNRVKFEVIREIETSLPMSIYRREIALRPERRWLGWKTRNGQIVVERVVPIVFSILYAFSAVLLSPAAR